MKAAARDLRSDAEVCAAIRGLLTDACNLCDELWATADAGRQQRAVDVAQRVIEDAIRAVDKLTEEPCPEECDPWQK